MLFFCCWKFKATYPTSSKNPKNWDKIAADVAAEEKDEKLEGDAALNRLFQQIYANGTDETRRAMNKSFVSVYSGKVPFIFSPHLNQCRYECFCFSRSQAALCYRRIGVMSAPRKWKLSLLMAWSSRNGMTRRTIQSGRMINSEH